MSRRRPASGRDGYAWTAQSGVRRACVFGGVSALLVLGAIVNLMFSGTDILCVLLSERAMRLLTMSQAASRIAHRVGGGILLKSCLVIVSGHYQGTHFIIIRWQFGYAGISE